MVKNSFLQKAAALFVAVALLISAGPSGRATAQEGEPVMLDPALGVRTLVSGLTTPTSLAFLNENEMFVLQKSTGEVLHLTVSDTGGATVDGAVLDLAVNFSSERGLLGIALDPDFANNGYVYLYWTCSAPTAAGSGFFPSEVECADQPQLGADTDDILAVPLIGNRVDRFVWDSDAQTLTWDMNLVKLRVFQNDSAPIPRDQGDEQQPPRGNHDGGVITFGQDGKLYIIIGDVGRRGALQNLPFGPIAYPLEGTGGTPPAPDEAALSAEQLDQMAELSGVRLPKGKVPMPDDQFGGPLPDDAHYTGVILRLNTDGSIPTDNPFYAVGSSVGGEIGKNIQKTFAYGIRNSFGMAVDPLSGNLWITENGEDAYDEINLVRSGFNSGWIQTMGPVAEVADYKEIEMTSLHGEDFPNLQQLRWGPENIANTPEEAMKRLFRLPGSRYSDPEFTWEFVIAPAAIGFQSGEGLGADYHGDLFMGLAVPLPLGGPLFRFDLTQNRARIAGIEETEAENEDFNSLKGSEQFLIGTNFGVVTDIETGPNGNLYVVSLTNGAVYEIFKATEAASTHFQTTLTGAEEVPGPGEPDGMGVANLYVNPEANTVCYSIVASDITLPADAAHIHAAEKGVAGDVVVPLTPPDENGATAGCASGVDPALIQAILQNPSGYYVNVHTSDFPAGAIRGQLPE